MAKLDTVYIHHPELTDPAGAVGVEVQVPRELRAHYLALGWRDGRLPGRAEAEEAAVAAELHANDRERREAAVRAAERRLLEQPNAEVDAFGNPLPPIAPDVLAEARRRIAAGEAATPEPAPVAPAAQVADAVTETAASEPVPEPQGDENTTTPERGRNR